MYSNTLKIYTNIKIRIQIVIVFLNFMLLFFVLGLILEFSELPKFLELV